MKISIVIPAYNEENTIQTVLENVAKLKVGSSQEIIVVDDGSVDKTAEIVEKMKSKIKNLHFYKHEKNQGKGAAVNTGIKKSTGDVIVIQDADLEYDPQDIPKLLDPILDKKARVIYGTRLKMRPILFGKNKTPFLLHFFGNKFLSLSTSVLYGQEVTDMETGYKLFDKNVLDDVTLKARSFDFEPEITAKILKKGITIHELPITTTPRGYDEGKKIHPVKDGVAALWTLVKYRFVN